MQSVDLGTIITPITPGRGIAVFTSNSGGKFIKAKEEDGIWKAITLLDYKGAGLVVFLSNISAENFNKIGPGEILKPGIDVKIAQVYDRHAVGDLVGEDVVVSEKQSFEEVFNSFMDLIEKTEDSKFVDFGGERFESSEFDTIYKLQDALYSYKEIEHEDRVSSTDDGDN